LGLIQKWKEFREYNKRAQTLEEILLSVSTNVDSVTKDQALNIPSVAGCVEIISNTVAMLPIKLYKDVGGKVEAVEGDNRVKLLNDDTKDALDAFQFKKSLVEDYLLEGAGYAYINKQRNNVKSLNYVRREYVSITKNADPIYKDYKIHVNGQNYNGFEYIKLIRKTKNGSEGTGIIKESNDMLTIAYLTLVYEKALLKTGGNKKGFLKSESKLSEPALTALKTAWNNLYKDNTENVVILNKGMEFQEASSTSVEMQMNENKKTNSAEMCKLFSMAVSILEGNATEEEYNNFIKICILPILKALTTALNRDLLIESEKDSFYFAVDTKELMKGDLLKRFQAYQIAINTGIMQWDEIRYLEDLAPYGLDFIKMGLQDVLYNIKTKQIYTPNTNKTSNITGKSEVITNNESGN
jgi:HK97 family phage portal protein